MVFFTFLSYNLDPETGSLFVRILLWIHGASWIRSHNTAIHSFCIQHMIVVDPDSQLASILICSLVKSLIFGILAWKKRFFSDDAWYFSSEVRRAHPQAVESEEFQGPRVTARNASGKYIPSPTEYTGCQAFCPVVRIGSLPPPHSQASVAPPRTQVLGRHTRLRGRGPNIFTKEQTFWNSRNVYYIIPLHPVISILCPSQCFCLLRILRREWSFLLVFTYF